MDKATDRICTLFSRAKVVERLDVCTCHCGLKCKRMKMNAQLLLTLAIDTPVTVLPYARLLRPRYTTLYVVAL